MLSIDASVTVCPYKTSDQSYAEVNIYVVGSTLEFLSLDSMSRQAEVEVLILFSQMDSVIRFDKYNLLSPVFQQVSDFRDIKRYSLLPGNYSVTIEISDLHREDNSFKIEQNITVDAKADSIWSSDLLLMAKVDVAVEESAMSKHGYVMEFLPFNYYNSNYEKLLFYVEIYDATKSVQEDYFIAYYIRDIESPEKQIYKTYKRLSPKDTEVVLGQIDMKKLVSGKFELVLEVRNQQKELLMEKVEFFRRSNPDADIAQSMSNDLTLEETFVGSLEDEQVIYALKAMAPKISSQDIDVLNYLLKKGKPEFRKYFLFNYWVTYYQQDPEGSYKKYMEVAKAVDQKFKSGFGFGFETDRGYIFMRYGKPDDKITVEDEPSAPPYEIWTYYDFPITSQSNVKFLFYNPSLITNGFELLHSNARGERQNQFWERVLYSSVQQSEIDGNYHDATSVIGGVNRRAREYFEEN